VFSESVKTTNVPTLAQMIRESRADQQILKRATREALHAWFRQSERLHIARQKYRLRGPRFVDFARRIGVTDQTSAYQLVKLHRHRTDILAKCATGAADAAKRNEPYRYPGWEAALAWFHEPGRRQNGQFWLTPSDLYDALDAEFHFDFDPCPYPLPKGFNALTMDWGKRNYVNPPFRKSDVVHGEGLTAFIRKAITEQRKGRTSVLVLPVFDYVAMLIAAGAEVRSLGHVPFRDVNSRRTPNHPPNCVCFVLRGGRARRSSRC
jgi:hypothetical protein